MRTERLGDYIRNLRKQSPQYQSLRKFAAAIDRSPSWVSKVERNEEKPSVETLIKTAELLKTDATELLQRAKKLDPELHESLALRYIEVSDLLLAIVMMSPQQIQQLTVEAERIFRGGN